MPLDLDKRFSLEIVKKEDSKEISDLIGGILRRVNSLYHSKDVISGAIGYSGTDNIELYSGLLPAYIVRNENGRIIGIGMLVNIWGKFTIGNLYVLEEDSGNGIGKVILNKLIEEVKNRGEKKIYVHSSRNAVSFYEKNGFKKIQEEDESETTLMERDL